MQKQTLIYLTEKRAKNPSIWEKIERKLSDNEVVSFEKKRRFKLGSGEQKFYVFGQEEN